MERYTSLLKLISGIRGASWTMAVSSSELIQVSSSDASSRSAIRKTETTSAPAASADSSAASVQISAFSVSAADTEKPQITVINKTRTAMLPRICFHIFLFIVLPFCSLYSPSVHRDLTPGISPNLLYYTLFLIVFSIVITKYLVSGVCNCE